MIKKIICFLFLAFGGIGIEQVASSTMPVEAAETVDIVDKWAHSDQDVREQYNKFLEILQEGVDNKLISQKDALRIIQGAGFAAEKHKSQLRKNAKQTPYFIHPLGVADHLMRVGNIYDPDVIIAALIHDTVNEELATNEELAKAFGKKVAEYVKELTDDKALSAKERKKMQIIQALHQSKGAAAIKLSDKWHNLNTLMKDPPTGWTQDRMDQYFQWAQVVIDNLPEVSSSLKEAADKTIVQYWEAQDK